jgi:hypothetical protein
VDGADESDRALEWLVTGTLAGMLHANGMSLEEFTVCFASGRSVLIHGLSLESTSAPTTLSAAVRSRGWSATAEWLRDIQVTLEHGLDEIREGRAVWVPMNAPKLPWEPLLLRYFEGQGCLRLAFGSEAAARAGRRVYLAVSAAERADWLSDREARQVANVPKTRWRRWIDNHREVRIGRPIARDGRPARNRRLVHRGDLSRTLRSAGGQDEHGDQICNPQDCWMSCWKAGECPRRECPKA